MLDYYKLLNIDREANNLDIKKAYRSAAMFWHPDKNKSPQAQQNFIDITEAYNILIDPNKREIYDNLYQLENNITLKNNQTNRKSEKQEMYEKWIKEERDKATKIFKLNTDILLTEGFHFLDQFGMIILLLILLIFFLLTFSQ